MEELLELHLYDSGITSLRDLKDLRFFVNLQCLNLHSNHITQIENLSTLVHLRELNLSSNDITKMDGLHHLGQLEILNLASNRIREVSGLEGIINLRRINLSFNMITTIHGFTALSGLQCSLQYVDLRGNRIASLDELRCLSKCPNLRYLNMKMDPPTRGNPLCMISEYRSRAFQTIPSLHSLDGYSAQMLPTHESDVGDAKNFPSLAPYAEFLPAHAKARPTSAVVSTPHIDQVLQLRRDPSRRSFSATKKQGTRPSYIPFT